MQFSILPAPDFYYTISAPTVAEFKEKASRFIGYAYPVADEGEVRQYLEQLRREHFKATHICYAYRLGLAGTVFRANDDGEPNATAGRPILGQIDSAELTQVLVAVVRYYGGVKLGTGGLKNAYKYGAKIALAAAEKVEKIVEEPFELRYNYAQTNELQHLLKQIGLEAAKHLPPDESDEQHCPRMLLNVRKSLQAALCEGLDKIVGLSYEKLPMA
jgi:uncharacterized YigZ family protein